MRVLTASICDVSFLGHAKDHVLLSGPCLVYALQRTRHEAEFEGALTELNLAQQQKHDADFQRRDTKKTDVHRRLTKRRNTQTEKSNQVKEDIKACLLGGMPAQDKHKLPLEKSAVDDFSM